VLADGAEASRSRVTSAGSSNVTKVDEASGSREPTDAERAAPDTSSSPSSRAVSAGMYILSAALALGAAALLLTGPLHGVGPVRHFANQSEWCAIVCILWAAAACAPVSLHHRGNTTLFLLTEIPLLLGLVFLSPALLVLSGAVANLFICGFVRRQELVKVAFNSAADAFSIALAAVVYREILGTHGPVSFQGWVAAAAALCCEALIAELTLRLAMRLLGQTAERLTGLQLTTKAMLLAATICLSLVVLNTAWFDLWATVPLLLVGGLIIMAYRGYSRLSLRFASLQRLYDFSRALGTASLEPSSMSLDVLAQVRTVMRARRAELILAEPTGIPRRISLDDRGASGVEPVELDPSSFVTRTITTGTAFLHSDATHDGGLTSDPVAGEYRDALVAPLMNEQTAIGAIVALDRAEALDHFDNDDLRLFEALVTNASANLERARLVEELRYEVDSKSHQATHDMLTGLPNRMLFLSRAASALRESQSVAIVLLDIDRFKDVNDTLGHAIGDRLLQELAERMLRAVPAGVTVARLGGDEFALVIPDVGEAERALAIVRDIHGEVSRPIKIEDDGMTLAVTASAGVALAPEHSDNADLLLQRADIAMYVAKEHRSTVELYSVEHDQSMQRWLTLGGLLTHALEDGSGLSVMYQPIAEVKSGQIVRVEALARWFHPAHGTIPPDEFIGIAEQMGLIGQISEFVLAESCANLASWRRAGLDIGLAVNVSGRELADASLIDRVSRHLQANGLPPEVLMLEVTETEVMDDLAQARKVLDELAGLGIRIAIDDYGTGYSSLAYLHRLPVQELKIDRSFVTNLPNDLSNAIIVRSSIAMAHSLGLGVVAEGAEDEVTCAMLADAGCDSIQGYYLSKPKSSADLQEWLLGGASLDFAPLESTPRPTVRV